MNIVQDISVPKPLDDATIEKVKSIAVSIKENFKDIDFYPDIRTKILNSDWQSDYESWISIEMKKNMAIQRSPLEWTEDELTEEDLADPGEDIPADAHYLIHENMDMNFMLVYLFNRNVDLVHPIVKEQYQDRINEVFASHGNFFNESMIFHFSPEGVLSTHDDQDGDYTLLVNISYEDDCGKMQVDDRVLNLGNEDAIIFNATHPHGVWNSSKNKTWFFVACRINPELFKS